MENIIDQKLEAANDWLVSTIGKVTHWHALLFVMLNAVGVSIATTGYLGAKSIDLLSPSGALYMFNFVVILLCISVVVRPNAIFLYKILGAGVYGFSAAWQILATSTKIAGYDPIISTIFGQILFFAGFTITMKWCFTGNHDIRQQVAISQSDYLEFIRFKNSNVHQLDQASEG